MIDIIIPVYNSKETLSRTLSSILIQINIPKIKIYIVDDNSSDNYDEIINHYRQFLDIKFLSLEKNSGPGVARQYGLQNSNSKYVIFIDSDDILANPFSINNLYEAIENENCDVVRSIIYEEKDNEFYEYKNENIGLHGKIYRREVLESKNIHFNNTRSNEDTSFNALVKASGAKYKDIDVLTYIWCNNKNSITRQNPQQYLSNEVKELAYNMYWALNESIKNNYTSENIKICAVEALLLIFDRLSSNGSNDNTDIFNYVNKIYTIFKKYSNSTSIDDTIKQYNLFNDYELIKLDFYKFIGEPFSIEKKYINQTERMKNRILFAPLDEESGNEKKWHVELMNEYNKTFPHEVDKRYELIKKMFGNVGNNFIIEPPFYANWGGKNVYVGDNVYINFNLSMVDDGNIYIGNNVLIGPCVKIITTNHTINASLRVKKYLYVKDVIIKDNVWIGSGAIILPGVTIGQNSVIGAGSVVTKDIPDNVVAVGNPCKVLREINKNDDIYFYKNEKIDWDNIV